MPLALALHQFSVDLVVGVLAISSVLGAGLYFARNRSSANAARDAADAWQREREAAVVYADRLKQQLHDTELELAKARARTDLTAFERVMEDRHKHQMEALRQGFQELAESQKATVQVLNLLVERLDEPRRQVAESGA